MLNTCTAVVEIGITAGSLDLLRAVHACILACLRNSTTLALPPLVYIEPAHEAGSLFLIEKSEGLEDRMEFERRCLPFNRNNQDEEIKEDRKRIACT